MTHEERMALAIRFNKERAANRASGQIATRKMIKADELSPEEMGQLVDIYPEWKPGVTVAVGELLGHNDALYEVIQAHTTQADWAPDIVPALFKSFAPVGVIPEWKQPTGAHDAYQTGDKVTFQGGTYESLINANTWSPATYPAGWKAV